MASGASRRGSEVTRAAGVHELQDVDHGVGCGVDWSVWRASLSGESTGATRGVRRKAMTRWVEEWVAGWPRPWWGGKDATVWPNACTKKRVARVREGSKGA